jgi:hypothetical protein
MTILSKNHYSIINKDQRIKRYNNSIIYLFTNGSDGYRTLSPYIFPKIVGTTYKNMVKVVIKNNKIISCDYIQSKQLASAQGYEINLPETPYLYKIIGCSIPSPIIEREINYFINRFNISKPKVGVLGGYGLESLAIGNTNAVHIFTQITNHTDNNYLKIAEITKTINSLNKRPKYIYYPKEYPNLAIEILIWKTSCRYGSNLSRNSNRSKQRVEREKFENEICEVVQNYIKPHTPNQILIELSSNINHKKISEVNKKKIWLFQKYIGNDYNIRPYFINTIDCGLEQNRNSLMVIFELNLPTNYKRLYDKKNNSNYYYNINTNISSWTY